MGFEVTYHVLDFDVEDVILGMSFESKESRILRKVEKPLHHSLWISWMRSRIESWIETGG